MMTPEEKTVALQRFMEAVSQGRMACTIGGMMRARWLLNDMGWQPPYLLADILDLNAIFIEITCLEADALAPVV